MLDKHKHPINTEIKRELNASLRNFEDKQGIQVNINDLRDDIQEETNININNANTNKVNFNLNTNISQVANDKKLDIDMQNDNDMEL